jgi:hypothetical protein
MAEELPPTEEGTMMRLPWKRTTESEQVANAGDVAQVKQKIADCELAIAEAEKELDRAALQAVLAHDQSASAATAKLDLLRHRRDLLGRALQAAEQKERETSDAARQREWIARKRSLAQKTGQLERDAAEVARAITALQDGIRRMEEAGQSIVALLPPSLRTSARPFHELFSPVVMRDLVRLERYRHGDRSSKPERLGNYMSFQDPRTAAVKGMTDVLAELTASVKQGFEQSGLPAKLPSLPSQPPAPETNGVVVDLRGVDLGVSKNRETDEVAQQHNAQEEEAVSADKPQEQGALMNE